ncbi:hypothetical protein BH11PSE9_BH11PSE9_06770 [soil metagenome]
MVLEVCTVSRFLFLSLAGLVAVSVGAMALLAPEVMLSTKGIHGNAAARVWMREVGAVLLATGVTAWLVRSHEDSPTLRALLWGNALLQIGLLPIELIAHAQGVIATAAGIVPNTVLHVVLAVGFVTHARAIRPQA